MTRQARQIAGIGAADLPNQAAVEAYVGPPREIVVGADTIRFHDGATPGGIPTAKRQEVEAVSRDLPVTPAQSISPPAQQTADFIAKLSAAQTARRAFHLPNRAAPYSVTAPLVIDNSTATGLLPSGNTPVTGDGSNQTVLQSEFDGGYLLDVRGGTFGNGGEVACQKIDGLTLRGQNALPAKGRKGLSLARTSFGSYRDLRFMEFAEAGYVEDVVGGHFDKILVQYCNRGLKFQPGPDALSSGTHAGSPPNELVFTSFHGVGCRNNVLEFVNSGNLTFLGGSFEALGTVPLFGIPVEADAYSLILRKPGLNAGVALSMFGTHFETNKAAGDVLIEHGDYQCSYNFYGCDFFQNGENFVQHHIVLDLTSATKKAIINFNGCTFRSENGYAPDASRKAVLVINPNNVPFEINNFGSSFVNAVERPIFTNDYLLDLGSAWSDFPGGASAGSGTGFTGTQTGRFKLVGKTVFFETVIVITAGDTGGDALYAALPVAAKTRPSFVATDNSGRGLVGNAGLGQSFMRITTVAGASPVASGTSVYVSGSYEAA